MKTESASPRYREIDSWPPADVLDALVEGQFAAVASVRMALPAIEAAAAAAEARLRTGGRLAYAGAGSSGRIAIQDGVELGPTFGWPPERLVLLMAGGEPALLRAVEGAEDSAADGARRVREHGIGPADTLVAVAASGATAFTLACLCEAKAKGALTVGIANNPDAPLLTAADQRILLDTGAEAIAGSTRMKANTAQKIALNLLSTLVMIRLGRVHDGLMVDLRAANAKLVRRSETMLMQIAGCGRGKARDALARADGSVKLAVLLLQGCTETEAQAALDRSGGRLREALTRLGARNAAE